MKFTAEAKSLSSILTVVILLYRIYILYALIKIKLGNFGKCVGKRYHIAVK